MFGQKQYTLRDQISQRSLTCEQDALFAVYVIEFLAAAGCDVKSELSDAESSTAALHAFVHARSSTLASNERQLPFGGGLCIKTMRRDGQVCYK
jgi:hypothetical protein